jgi:uracil-DNA glycosylase
MSTYSINPIIEDSWKQVLSSEFQQEYFHNLKNFLLEERKKYSIFPKGADIFNAFNLTPFDNVRVVILGQDPYHNPGQAHGLCFSVPKGITQPPSLVNILKEIQTDLGLSKPEHGNLEKWARQGVLLLNATLTVRANQPGSHQNRGWETFTDAAIKALAEKREKLVFLLWGAYAQNKVKLIDPQKHLILKAPHPSPLSVYRGFFGCKHFSTANSYLKQNRFSEIDWSVD